MYCVSCEVLKEHGRFVRIVVWSCLTRFPDVDDKVFVADLGGCNDALSSSSSSDEELGLALFFAEQAAICDLENPMKISQMFG